MGVIELGQMTVLDAELAPGLDLHYASLLDQLGLVPVLRRSPISLCHLGLERERADAAQI